METYELRVSKTLPTELFQAVDEVEWANHVANGRPQTVTVGVVAESHEEAVALIRAHGFEIT